MQNPTQMPNRPLFIFSVTLVALFFLGLLLTAAHAAETTITPSISVAGGYDDNVYQSEKNEVSSSRITVTPSVELDYQTLLSNVSMKADWNIRRYLDESDLDRTNQYYRLNGTRRIKNRLDTSAEFKFIRDTTFDTYLEETGRDTNSVERDFFDADISAAYDITMVSGVSATYRYQNADYDTDTHSDFDKHRGSLYYYHRLKSQVDRLSLGPAYYYRKNDSSEVDSYSLDIGWDRNWSRITHTKTIIGARYAESKRQDGTDSDSWGVKANFNLTFAGEVSETKVEYFHDIRTTVDGYDINVDNLYVDYDRRLTERFGAGINGRIVFSYKLFDQQADINDSRYYWVEPYLYYRLTPHLRIFLLYRYQNWVEFQDSDDDINKERNLIWLRLRYDLPFLL